VVDFAEVAVDFVENLQERFAIIPGRLRRSRLNDFLQRSLVAVAVGNPRGFLAKIRRNFPLI
jgi:hypothetical protein